MKFKGPKKLKGPKTKGAKKLGGTKKMSKVKKLSGGKKLGKASSGKKLSKAASGKKISKLGGGKKLGGSKMSKKVSGGKKFGSSGKKLSGVKKGVSGSKVARKRMGGSKTGKKGGLSGNRQGMRKQGGKKQSGNKQTTNQKGQKQKQGKQKQGADEGKKQGEKGKGDGAMEKAEKAEQVNDMANQAKGDDSSASTSDDNKGKDQEGIGKKALIGGTAMTIGALAAMKLYRDRKREKEIERYKSKQLKLPYEQSYYEDMGDDEPLVVEIPDSQMDEQNTNYGHQSLLASAIKDAPPLWQLKDAAKGEGSIRDSDTLPPSDFQLSQLPAIPEIHDDITSEVKTGHMVSLLAPQNPPRKNFGPMPGTVNIQIDPATSDEEEAQVGDGEEEEPEDSKAIELSESEGEDDGDEQLSAIKPVSKTPRKKPDPSSVANNLVTGKYGAVFIPPCFCPRCKVRRSVTEKNEEQSEIQ